MEPKLSPESAFFRTILPILLVIGLLFVLVNWEVEPYVYRTVTSAGFDRLSLDAPCWTNNNSNSSLVLAAKNIGTVNASITALILKDEAGNVIACIPPLLNEEIRANGTLSNDNDQLNFDLRVNDCLALELTVPNSDLDRLRQARTITLVTASGGAFVSLPFTNPQNEHK